MDCFERAYEWFLDNGATLEDDGQRVRLIHGRPTLQVEPFEPFMHAWVETTEFHNIQGMRIPVTLVVDPSQDPDNPTTVPQAVYYLAGKIDADECVEYTLLEANRKIKDTGHYGSWHNYPPGTCYRNQDGKVVRT